MARLLIISAEAMGDRMAGPAIRAFELAAALSGRCQVQLAAPRGSSLPVGGTLDLHLYDPRRPRSLARALGGNDVVLAPPLAPGLIAAIRQAGRPWIADLVNPEPFEGLEFGRGLPPSRRRAHEILRADRLAFAARTAAAFVCAHERQRDMWLGFLAAHRRLSGSRYQADRTLERLITLVPSGIPDTPPRRVPQPAIRGVHVAVDARLAIWNGGLWDWLDPLTVIEAIALLRQSDPRWALVFLGSERPAGARHMTMHRRARELADARGLVAERAVHFEPEWTPYHERGARLLEADVGVCAHPASAETRFAARTRLLDLLWAGLPVVSSTGDVWSEFIVEERLGAVAPPGDPTAYARALEVSLAPGSDYRASLATAAAKSTWTVASAPLPDLIDAVAGEGSVRRGLVALGAEWRHRAASALSSQRMRPGRKSTRSKGDQSP
jgi:glycosyltransferase involved in cell wall biosynthesis